MILKVGDKMKEDQKKRRNLIAKISGIFLGLVLVLGISYAIFRTSDVAEKTNRINTADFNVEIQNESEKAIALENAAPMSALEGQKQSPYTFDVVNIGTIPANYTLYLEVPNTSTLPSNKIKYYLTRSDIGNLPLTRMDATLADAADDGSNQEKAYAVLYSSLLSQAKVTTEGDKTLYTIDTGIIGPGQRQSYSLNMWVSYASGVEVTNKSFEAKVRVDAEQASTDAIYPLESVSLYDGEDYNTRTLRVSLYSDYSVRFEGNGFIDPKTFSNISPEALLIGTDKKTFLTNINSIFEKYGFDEQFTTIDELFSWISSADSSLVDEDMMNELNTAVDNITYTFNGKVYFGDGITQLGSNSDSDTILAQLAIANQIEKIFISESVTHMGVYLTRYLDNLKEVHFTDIVDEDAKVGSLTLNSIVFLDVPNLEIIEFGDNLVGITASGSISNLTNLKTITLPTSLKTLHYQAIQNCPNADVNILAKQSDVTISVGSTLNLGVKSTNWING